VYPVTVNLSVFEVFCHSFWSCFYIWYYCIVIFWLYNIL